MDSVEFAGWDGLTLTDSGGFQVFSLDPKVDDDGVTFKSTYDGSTARFTPEDRGPDPAAARRRHPDGARPVPAVAERARGRPPRVERTTAWARRAKQAHTRADQALFGIVQGGVCEAMRAESARAHGRDRLRRIRHRRSVRRRNPRADAARAGCGDRAPARRPAALSDGSRRPGVAGRGRRPRRRPVRLRDADAARTPRHGIHRVRPVPGQSRAQRRTRRTARPECPCDVCARHSRGYIRHLLQVGEPTASRLLSIHNVAWTIDLMDRMRLAIHEGRFEAMRRDVLDVWG